MFQLGVIPSVRANSKVQTTTGMFVINYYSEKI